MEMGDKTFSGLITRVTKLPRTFISIAGIKRGEIKYDCFRKAAFTFLKYYDENIIIYMLPVRR